VQLYINSSDGVPIYLQIVNQVKHLAASGRLAAGEEIPPIRALAAQLVINPNTVARAYLELERAGIVIKRQGAGTYIADVSSPLSRRGKFKLLKQRADALLVEADHLGIGLSEVVELVQECHETMHKQEPQP
jgi:GntR family transcriptional regulator